MPTGMLNKYRGVISSGKAFVGWKQSEDAPHNMPALSSLSAMASS